MVLDTDMFSITIDRYNPDKVWVSTCGWVYNTPNRGENWTRYRDGFNNRRIHDIELDPCDPDSIFAGSVAGLYRSHDGGKTWYTISDESLVVNTIALHPQRPGRVILGVEGDGVYISNDNAKTFTRSCDGLRNLTITSIAADAAQPKNVYAAVAFGGSSSGIYRSTDAGATWKKLPTNDLPQILSLVITEDAEVKFVAGTEKGFFWSADGEMWSQAPPASYPIRVDKVLRFNKVRYFAATAEGVFTSRDAGKSWYRLAGADDRAVDIAIGNLGEKRALFALTNAGLRAFDGMQWIAVEGATAKGRTLAVRGSGRASARFRRRLARRQSRPHRRRRQVDGDGSARRSIRIGLRQLAQHRQLRLPHLAPAAPDARRRTEKLRLALVPAPVVDRRGDVGRPRPLRYRTASTSAPSAKASSSTRGSRRSTRRRRRSRKRPR